MVIFAPCCFRPFYTCLIRNVLNLPRHDCVLFKHNKKKLICSVLNSYTDDAIERGEKSWGENVPVYSVLLHWRKLRRRLFPEVPQTWGWGRRAWGRWRGSGGPPSATEWPSPQARRRLATPGQGLTNLWLKYSDVFLLFSRNDE